MKIKDGFILRKIADTDMVVPIGDNIAYFNGIISLNETAAFLWKKLSEGVETSALTEALMETYQISREVAEADTEQFIYQLREAAILADNL